ncbi:methyltransferase domain-containing protein [Erysipelothrix urinaevulpis]|uniref:methyltransferase domain-containing protein n=1 Tax=Erysipelothrix urinaevulpis TaxID=2683717 RepID=UPI0013568696|nr:methyltransferase domain-containing protein [Erysipelothrix urinaevulpis]
MKSKKEKSIDLCKNIVENLRCPFCYEDVEITLSMTCHNNHNFDFSKTGYLNLALQSSDKKYNAELFKERYKIMGLKNVYQPLVDALTDLVPWTQHTKVLDGGTGEGSLLARLPESVKIGVDLAKDGIVLASKNYPDHLWFIADLANLPVKDNAIDRVLSILSPASYQEFKRVLKPGGELIKVIPNANYFKEIRELGHQGDFDNSHTVNRFKEEFPDYQVQTLSYTVLVNEEDRESLIKMSPLAWDLDEKIVRNYIKQGKDRLTIDLSIYYGKRGLV